jgi:hypothetical protein
MGVPKNIFVSCSVISKGSCKLVDILGSVLVVLLLLLVVIFYLKLFYIKLFLINGLKKTST